MRILGLISGGKDSIFNLIKCIAANHEIVALANIHPSGPQDELDSFMYQTVGHEAVSLVAEAVGLPLFRQTTQGRSFCDSLTYKTISPSDEVEDLHRLVAKALEEVEFEGVAVGAIASDYQRLRVEDVCVRLGLTSVAYLWREDQASLLSHMISNIDAILVKVASMGLEPSKHLGVSIKDIEAVVSSLHEKYGCNVCGEGGEYETFVLDCPLYHSKIVIDDFEMKSDPVSGYIRINKAHLEEKFGVGLKPADTLAKRLQTIRQLIPHPDSHIQDCLLDIPPQEDVLVEESDAMTVGEMNAENKNSKWLYIGNLLAPCVHDAIFAAKDKLAKNGMTLNDVVCSNLWLQNMAEFAVVNGAYVKGMEGVAPARACVAVPLPTQTPVLLELLAHPANKELCHVQSYSNWAPANIGPYSQSTKVGNIIVLAGQIPMIPGTMALLNGPLIHQIRLCLRHAQRILAVSKASLDNVLQATVYVATQENAEPAVATVRSLLKDANPQVVGVVVATLPRNADVEIQVIAALQQNAFQHTKVAYDLATLRLELSTKFNKEVSLLTGYVSLSVPETIDWDDMKLAIKHCLQGSTMVRVLFSHHVRGMRDGLLTVFQQLNASDCVTLVPIVSCARKHHIITIISTSLR